MTLDLSFIEHPQVQNASPSIGYLKELLNCHLLLLKTYVEIENMLCFSDWLSLALSYVSKNEACYIWVWLP
jgi:hypothetical protein